MDDPALDARVKKYYKLFMHAYNFGMACIRAGSADPTLAVLLTCPVPHDRDDPAYRKARELFFATIGHVTKGEARVLHPDSFGHDTGGGRRVIRSPRTGMS